MSPVVHILDRTCPADLLRQVEALARPEDVVLSLGPEPRTILPITRSIARPLGSAALTGRALSRAIRPASLLHCWGWSVVAPAVVAARRTAGRVAVSVPALPARREAVFVPWDIAMNGLDLILPTQAAARWVIAAGADPARVHVLSPPGLAEPPEATTRARVRSELGLDDGEVLIAAPSEMLTYAGHDQVSWIHAICRHVQPRGRIIMPGSGTAEGHVNFFAHTTGFGQEVHFTRGRFSLAEVLAGADIVAVLHRCDLGVTPVASAISAGRAILATDTPDHRELLTDDQTALLVEPGSQRIGSARLLELLTDTALRTRLGQAAAEQAAAHHPAAAAARLEEIHDAIAARPI
jgi:hypothetical protein